MAALVSTKVMDALKTIGLNLYERKLWIALLAKGTATAGELSQMSGVPRSRTYDTLESLADKGFVITQTGKPVSFVAIKPEEALERVKRKVEEDGREMEKRIDELKKSSLVRELNDLFGKGVETVMPEELTITIKGRQQLAKQMSTIFKSAGKRIQIVVNAGGLNNLNASHFDQLKKAKNRGVSISIATLADDKSVEAARSLSSVADVKTFQENMPVKGNFYIVDGRELIFSLTDPGKVEESKHVAFWSRSEHATADVLEPLFKIIWENAKILKPE